MWSTQLLWHPKKKKLQAVRRPGSWMVVWWWWRSSSSSRWAPDARVFVVEIHHHHMPIHIESVLSTTTSSGSKSTTYANHLLDILSPLRNTGIPTPSGACYYMDQQFEDDLEVNFGEPVSPETRVATLMKHYSFSLLYLGLRIGAFGYVFLRLGSQTCDQPLIMWALVHLLVDLCMSCILPACMSAQSFLVRRVSIKVTENTGRVIWLLLWAGILERQAGRLQKYR